MKKFIILVVVMALLAGGTYAYFNKANTVAFVNETKAAEPKVQSKTEQVKKLIDQLTEERKQNETFKAKKKQMEAELEKEVASMRQALKDHLEASARLDALTIVQTQYDMEISELQKISK
jgi:predicted ribosomally synthesized peptide with SipW-like signal peptide